VRTSAILLAAFLLAQAPAGAQTTDLERAREEQRATRAEAALARANAAL
jgi:hypothetical protein